MKRATKPSVRKPSANRSDLSLVQLAADFAARRHVNQRRKGASKEPYVNHLIEVADLLAEASGGRDPALVAAGLLHDTLEDTEPEYEELVAMFGEAIAAIVAEVTDDKSLPKDERKRRQVASAPHKSTRARLVKIADKTSNLRAIALSPPADWDKGRLLDYIDWSQKVVAGCRGLNAALEKQFDEAVTRARTAVGAAMSEGAPS
jgi:(p)ppGpp synthase/HD superfamily hydrolase